MWRLNILYFRPNLASSLLLFEIYLAKIRLTSVKLPEFSLILVIKYWAIPFRYFEKCFNLRLYPTVSDKHDKFYPFPVIVPTLGKSGLQRTNIIAFYSSIFIVISRVCRNHWHHQYFALSPFLTISMHWMSFRISD